MDKMLSKDLLEPAQSEGNVPVVLTPKKDSSLCFCDDFRRLNDSTIGEMKLISKMDEWIDSLDDAKMLPTLRAKSRYRQVEVLDGDRDNTTFTIHHGIYLFIRMPFSLKNAPRTCQRALDVILSHVRRQFALYTW